jgi:hypothetical protein
MTTAPNVLSPTTLEAFGKPNVAIDPRAVTSVWWMELSPDDAARTPHRFRLLVGCGGLEIPIGFRDQSKCEACFDWLLVCMKNKPA